MSARPSVLASAGSGSSPPPPSQERTVQRLKSKAQYQAVMAGATVSRTAHFALHRASIDAAPPMTVSTGPGSERPQALFAVRAAWMGAVVPKRWAKRAVTRNTIKRQIYTMAHDLREQLPIAAHVVRLRTGFDRQQFHSPSSELLKRAVRAELQQLFSQARA